MICIKSNATKIRQLLQFFSVAVAHRKRNQKVQEKPPTENRHEIPDQSLIVILDVFAVLVRRLVAQQHEHLGAEKEEAADCQAQVDVEHGEHEQGGEGGGYLVAVHQPVEHPTDEQVGEDAVEGEAERVVECVQVEVDQLQRVQAS